MQTERIEKSVGHEETFSEDVADVDFLRAELLRLAEPDLRAVGRIAQLDLVDGEQLAVTRIEFAENQEG